MVSPFGFGEITLKDFETFLSGSVLVKPNMSHMETYPNFYIDDAYGMRVYLGADIYRSANALATETDFFKAKMTYYTGDHKITAGYENTVYDIYNVFVIAQDGAWEFDTLADYEAGVASAFEANNAKDGNVDGAAAIFDYGL